MKTLFIVLAAFFTMQTVSAQSAVFSAKKKSAIVDNLVKAISSENTGLRTSGAKILSDLISESYLEPGDASKAMIPLLKLLRNGKTEEERLAAAVALYQIGSPIAIYQLRGVGLFDENKKVALVCKNLYYTYHTLHGTEYLVSF
jgi:HEAT repeat protein